jgi:predicted DNA-binding transcriptional regulator YafY
LQLPTTAAKLYQILRRGEAFTQQEITDRLSIGSKRQARRLIGRLKEAGLPIEEQYRDRRKEYRLPPEEWEAEVRLDLSEREALALLLAAWAAESGLGSAPLTSALSRATQSLVEGLPASVSSFDPGFLMDQFHFGEAASVDVDPAVFMDLVEALSNRRSIKILYYSASSDEQSWRRVDPWGLAVRGEAWLCVAHDYRHEERRDFNLTRIEEIRPFRPESNGGDYRVPDDFDLEVYFAGRFESLDAEDAYEVELLVEADIVSYFESKDYHETQQIRRTHSTLKPGSGRVVVSYDVVGLEEIAAFVRSWGPKVKVLRPPELAERIAQEARATAARYDANESKRGSDHESGH